MVDSGNSIAGATTPPPGGPPNHTTGLPPTSHFALYRAGTISQPSRLVYAKWESTNPAPPTGNDVRGCGIGHGTLCAHIIAGNVPASLPRALPHAENDPPNFYYGLGVAPFVRIGSSAIFNSGGTFVNPNFNDMLARSYQYGARISSNSWGAAVSGAYNTSSQAYDFLVRDAQQPGSAHPTPGNQEMVIVFAAGNSGPPLVTKHGQLAHRPLRRTSSRWVLVKTPAAPVRMPKTWPAFQAADLAPTGAGSPTWWRQGQRFPVGCSRLAPLTQMALVTLIRV